MSLCAGPNSRVAGDAVVTPSFPIDNLRSESRYHPIATFEAKSAVRHTAAHTVHE